MRSLRDLLTVRSVIGVVLAGTLLVGCGAAKAADATTSASSAAASSAVLSAGAAASAGMTTSSAVTISDPWVKATSGAQDSTMTAAFGVLHNSSNADLTVVSATNTATDRTELHEMAMVDGAMVMRAVAGGITVPADGTTTLEPGGLHVMILDAQKPIVPGEEIGVTLTMSDGSTLEFSALAKDFAGANEHYDGGTSSGSMDMGGDSTSELDMGGASASMTGP